MDNTVRFNYIDTLKTIATIAVISIHILALFFDSTYISFDWYVSVVYDSLCRWAVPIFVMASGALFLNSKKKITIKSIYTKYIKRILFALLFWLLIYTILSSVKYEDGFYIDYNELKDSFSFLSEYTYHLWFLPMIIGLYMTVPVFRVLIQNKKVTEYFILMWLIFSIYNLSPSSIPFVGSLKLNMFTGYCGYFLLGGGTF